MEGSEEGTTERRAEDQDTALEQAFVSGALPEADRREEDPKPTPATDTVVGSKTGSMSITVSVAAEVPATTQKVDRRVVRATARGFHGKIREIGEVFEIGGDEEVGAWMEIVRVVNVVG